MRNYYVYILTNQNGTLYTGVTGNIGNRVFQHRTGTGSTFTSKYRTAKLVHAEQFDNVHEAIAREKQIKGWTRVEKAKLISEANPGWEEIEG